MIRWVEKISDYSYALRCGLRDGDVDGRSLLQLTADDLRTLGVPQLGPRLALLARVGELRELRAAHETLLDSERRIPYSTNLLVLFLSWAMLLVLALLKGGGKKAGQSPVAAWQGKTQEEFCRSAGFWILWWVGVPVLVGVTYLAGNYLLAKHRLKVRTHFAFHEGDVKWTERRVRLCPIAVIAAGVLAGLLGVGGAMVTGPLMLEMGMMPRVSTVTSSFLIIFTTGVAAIAYMSLGTLRMDYASWFALMGGMGAAVGLKIIAHLVKKYKRQSMVIWSLTLVFVLATAATIVVGVVRVLADGFGGFRPICG